MDKGNERMVTIVGIGAGLFLVYKLVQGWEGFAEMLGLKDSAETKALDDAAQTPNNFWSPNFYKAYANARILTRAGAEGLAKKIKDAMGWFDDDEDAVKAVFRSLTAQSQVSFLAEVFQQVYGSDLLSFLRGGNPPFDRLSDQDVADINSYVAHLPKY